jgi:hypothetical protein
MLVLDGTTTSSPQIIGCPVYIIHWASNTSEHGCGSGQFSGVGHGGGVVRKLSLHPQFILV